eukprot:gene1707-4831_t
MDAAMFGDAAHCKQLLDVALGRNVAIYWRMFSQFVKGKRSRQDFDLFAKSILSKSHEHLHNDFILTVLQTAESATNHIHVSQKHTPPSKHKEIDQGAPSWLERFDRDLKYSPNPLKMSGKQLEDASVAEYRAGPAPVTTSRLRAATIVTASEAGMSGIDPAVFSILSTACEIFLKNLLEESIVYGGKYFSIRNRARHSFRNRPNKRSIIRPSNLLLAGTARPRLLGALFRSSLESFGMRCETSTVLPHEKDYHPCRH